MTGNSRTAQVVVVDVEMAAELTFHVCTMGLGCGEIALDNRGRESMCRFSVVSTSVGAVIPRLHVCRREIHPKGR